MKWVDWWWMEFRGSTADGRESWWWWWSTFFSPCPSISSRSITHNNSTTYWSNRYDSWSVNWESITMQWRGTMLSQFWELLILADGILKIRFCGPFWSKFWWIILINDDDGSFWSNLNLHWVNVPSNPYPPYHNSLWQARAMGLRISPFIMVLSTIFSTCSGKTLP